MADNKQVVYNTLLQATGKGVLQQEKGNFQQLQNNAKFFLDNINIFKQSLMKKTLRQQASWLIRYRMRKNSDISTLMFYLSKFEQQINNFLGRQIYFTYVCQNGTLKLFDNLNAQKIYFNMEPDKGGRGKMRANNELNNFSEMLQGQLIEQINQSAKNKQRVYTQALRRFNKPADSSGKKGMRYKAQNNLSHTFYYRLFDYYHLTDWSIKTNLGQISEAYADAVISEDNTISNSMIEWSLYHLDNRLQNQNKANSIAAIIQGDVKLSPQIQFAIKSGNLFGSPRIRQFIAFAYNILLFDNLTINQVNDNLKKLSNIQANSNLLLQEIKNYSEEEATKIISKVNLEIST